VAAALAIGLVAGACAGDPEPVALTTREISESLVRDTLSVHIGIGELRPTCPEVDEPTIGATWTCTATTEDDRIIELEGRINDRGQVDVATTNVISSASIPSYEEIAAAALSNSTPGLELTVDAVDCGPSSLVLTEERQVVCALVDPRTRETYDMTLTIEDLEGREFGLLVAEQPRP
jgi:hypothetical protein